MKDGVWDKLAETKGFKSIKELLQHSYIDENASAKAIADALGCSEATIYNLLDLHGIPKRKKAHKEVNIKKRDLLNVPVRELASKHGVSPATIWRMRNKLKGSAGV